MPDFAVIIPAAGKSTRYGSAKSKLLEPLAGRTVLEHSLAAFTQRRDVICIVIAGGESLGIAPSKRIIHCQGGSCRAASVRNALLVVPSDIEWIAVHDGARPLVSQDLIDRCLAAAVQYGAAVPALAVAQTIRQATGPLPAKSSGVVPRSLLWAMQTPQIMRRRDLLSAYERFTSGISPSPCTQGEGGGGGSSANQVALALEEITDDAQLLKLAGQEVWLVQGEERNLKITTPIDLVIAQTVLSMERSRELSTAASPPAAKPPAK